MKTAFYKINPSQVDWESENSLVFFNEKHAKKDIFVSSIPQLPYLKSHVWLATSGRVCQKWVALSKEALLTSAQAVNRHLHVTEKDRWGLCLPLFHVGGLAILARAHLSHSSCFLFSGKWSASSFLAFLNQNKITLSSLVPAQVYDIVKAQHACPSFLRAVVVGGESLNPILYHAARKLNWPLLPSYGLTECASQVATAELDTLIPHRSETPAVPREARFRESRGEDQLHRGMFSNSASSLEGASLRKEFTKTTKPALLGIKPDQYDKMEMPKMKTLSHVQVKIIQKKVAIQSGSLLSGFVSLLPSSSRLEFQNPSQDGWYFTEDKGSLEGSFLQIDNTAQIKILGEKINLEGLEDTLMNIVLKKKEIAGQYILLPIPSEREGFQIALISDVFNRPVLADLIQEFNKKVSPFERIRKFYLVPELTFTDISKLSKQALLKKMAFSSEKRA
ncbi:MAG: AMP-binding protein [Bdellovibrionales bacterium]|nr:AMP-binding protein [Bdellovibrionales bacterium]